MCRMERIAVPVQLCFMTCPKGSECIFPLAEIRGSPGVPYQQEEDC